MSDRQQSKQPETGVDRLKAQRKGLPTLDKLVTETKRRIEGIQSALSAFERERRKRIAAEEKASLAAVEAHGVPAAAESAVPPQPPAEREPARVAPTVVPEPQAEAARPAESVPAPVEEPAAAPKTAAADEPRREKPPEKPAQAKRSQAKPAEGQEKPKPDAQPKPKAEPAVAAAPKPDAAAAEPPKAASAAAKPLPSFLVSLPKPGETRIFNTPGTTRSRTFDSTGAARPPRAYPPRPGVPGRPSGGGYVAPPPTQNNNKRGEKKTYERAERPEDKAKAAANKRTLATRKPLIAGEDDERGGGRKLHRGRNRNEQQEIMSMVSHAVVTTENMTVKMLSELIGISVAELIKQFLFLDIKVTINSVVDFDSMALVGDVLGVTLELKVAQTKAEAMEEMHDLSEDDPSVLEVRPPIVTVMGHVDHGKTSVLDAIRRTNVAQGEAGGITQHIGAYSVTLKGKNITFLDTPGHEAFTMMRARGTQVTDIAVIVIAADDGIMPQTVEAINHAKSAGVSIIVAANKIDKPAADVARLKQQLTEHELLPEEWGGDVPVVPVSAKTGEGLDSLLENILILAEVKELKANPNRAAHGTVIEAQLDKNKGPVATIIVQNGTLRVGNSLISGTSFGKVRAMTDDKGRPLKEAGPSTAVAVLGLQDVPVAGDKIYVVDSERAAKAVADERAAKVKGDKVTAQQSVSLEDVFSRISEGQLKDLNLILKADVQGSVEAIRASLVKASNEEVRVNVVHSGVGAITKSDVMLAEASHAIIIGFHVRPDAETKALAEKAKIDIRLYRIIYEAIDDVNAAIKGMLAPKFKEQIIGHAVVRTVFKLSTAGIVAGCYVQDGKITQHAKIRIFRDNVVTFDGEVDSLRRFKDDVKEVAFGYECGLTIVNYADIKEEDVFEAYILERVVEK